MPGFNQAGAGVLLEGARTTFLAASLHTGDPGANGANEVANTGSYARLTIPWDASVGTDGRLDTQSDLVFGGPTVQVTVTHVGYWSSTTYGGGTFYNSHPLSTSKLLVDGDTVTIGTDDLALYITIVT